MEALITGTNTRVMWERQPRTREVWLGVEVKMEAASAAVSCEVTPLGQLWRWRIYSSPNSNTYSFYLTVCTVWNHNNVKNMWIHKMHCWPLPGGESSEENLSRQISWIQTKSSGSVLGAMIQLAVKSRFYYLKGELLAKCFLLHPTQKII